MNNTSNIDTNIDNYTTSELMAIVGVNDMDQDEIQTKTNNLINKFKTRNPTLAVFFQEIQTQLLQDASNSDKNSSGNNDEQDQDQPQASVWYENQNLTQLNDFSFSHLNILTKLNLQNNMITKII
jgi:hypothetical protein